MKKGHRHLAVVGGGIAGLATAIALERVGIEATVFEKRDVPPTAGGPLGLWPNALRALEFLGLADEVLDHSTPLTGMTVRSSTGRLLWRFPLARLAAGQGPFVIIHRTQLLRILQQRAPRITHHSALVCGFHESQVGVWPLLASFGARERMEFDGLIGADGLRSVVRTQLFPHQVQDLRTFGSILSGVSETHVEAWPFPIGESVSIPGYGRFLQAFAVPSGRSTTRRVFWWTARLGLKRAPDHGHLWGSSEIERLLLRQSIERPLRLPLHRRPVATSGRGCVTLVGDAAHPLLPTIGQGAAQGLCGAVLLARQLAQDQDIESAFRAYEAAHWTRIGRIRRLEWKVTMGLAAYLPSGFKQLAMNALAPLTFHEYRAVLADRGQ